MKKIIVSTLLVETSPQALPLGAACIVSALRSDAYISSRCEVILHSRSAEDPCFYTPDGHKCIFSECARFIAEDISRHHSSESPAAAVMFSLYVWNAPVLAAAARLLRQMIPSVVLCAGGPEVTASPETYAAYFDYVVTGEGEKAVVETARKILDKRAGEECGSNVGGNETGGESGADEKTVRMCGSGIVVRGTKCPAEQLVSPYLSGAVDPAEYGGALWELARGCPFKCSYCYESKGEKKVVYFPIERIKKELALFKEKNIAQVFVLDPTYNADNTRAREILSLIKESADGMFFHFEVRAEYIDRTTAKLFASIPCSLQIGLQSADEEVLRLVHRPFNRKEFVRKIAVLNEAGAVFGFDLIYGLPGDTLRGFIDSIDFALGMYPNHLELFRLSVLPGTDLFDRADELCLKRMAEPPYHIISTPSFSSADLEKAERLARSVSLFYSAGRAVSWFSAVIHPLKMKPSKFFTGFAASFAQELKNTAVCTHREIERLQLIYIEETYRAAKLEKYLPIAQSLIRLYGAISRSYAENEMSEITLSYHPEYLESLYVQDFASFFSAVKMKTCRVRVTGGKNGPQWKVLC